MPRPLRDHLNAKTQTKGYFLSILINAACMNNDKHNGSGAKIKNITQVISKHCKTLDHLHQLHAYCLVSGRNNDIFLNSFLHTLLSLPSCNKISYLNLNRTHIAYLTYSTRALTYALALFNQIKKPTTFSFNNVIRAHTLFPFPFPFPFPSSPLLLFARMRSLAIPPDSHTFPFALTACAHLEPTFALQFSQALHSQTLKFGFYADSFVLNSLIRVYSICGRLTYARRVFDESPSQRDLVSYNTMIDGYVKSGELSSARQLFDEMPERDSVSWGTIIAGYSQSNRCGEAMLLFYRMLELRFRPDSVALVSVLSACAKLGDLDRGRYIHEYINQNGIHLNPFLTTVLVDFYAKCGCIDKAKEIFDNTSASSEKIGLCTWNAIIVGFAMHGLGELSLSYFQKMTKEGIKPDGVSFLGVLVGCSHAGLVEQACELFDVMERVYLVPRELKHYGCMADLLGRAGRIQEAIDMIRAMPIRGDVYVWGGLLAGCRLHAGNVDVAEEAARRVMELRPEDDGVYSIMAGVYANAEQWDDVVRIRKWRDSKSQVVRKNAGCSLIRLEGVTHEFVAWDGLHPQSDEIYSVLNRMEKHQLEAY